MENPRIIADLTLRIIADQALSSESIDFNSLNGVLRIIADRLYIDTEYYRTSPNTFSEHYKIRKRVREL